MSYGVVIFVSLCVEGKLLLSTCKASYHMQSSGEKRVGWTRASNLASRNILHHSKFPQGTKQLKCIPHCVQDPLHLLAFIV